MHPTAMPSINEVVDLTGDLSSADGNSTVEEVIVNPNRPDVDVSANADADVAVIVHGTKFYSHFAPWASIPQPRDQDVVGKPVANHASSSALKRTPNPASPAKSTIRQEGTPSKSTRFSAKEEVIGSQPQPLSSRTDLQCSALAPPPSHQTPNGHQTPAAQTPRKSDWTVDKIAVSLTDFYEAVGEGHSRLVHYLLEEAEKKAPRPSHLSSIDDFADMKSTALDSGVDLDAVGPTIELKFKLHNGEHGKSTKGQGRRVMYPFVCIKSDRDAVPGYRFHHVEIRKNILTPNTMLNFVPHLRDVEKDSAEESQYNNWLMELDKLDHQSGFKVQDRGQKAARRQRDEYAAKLSMYLEPWLQKLGVEGCSKSSLIRYMASQPEHDDAITPQQKTNILDTYAADNGSPHAMRGAKMFTEAFDRVFNDRRSKAPRVSLRDLLLLDKSVETIVDNKRAKDTPTSQKEGDDLLVPKIESALMSYSILGCLICFSHDCEHGEFDADNQRGTFGVEGAGGIARVLKKKWKAQKAEAEKNSHANSSPSKLVHQPCKNQCYRSYDTGNPAHPVDPWSESEVQVLEWVFATIGLSPLLKAQCFVASILGRKCWDVYGKLIELKLALPPVERLTEAPKVKALSWYDRKKKQLLGDWQDCTVSHEHAMREVGEPCHHDGPCTGKECVCATAQSRPVLCERFCTCTAEECALKFTGCACHSSGKTCLQRQKEGKPCICVQLNRECDPVLCKGCGARERADPENALDDHLHSTGCQNVALQRGVPKRVMLGKSQLPACGYGLFTAEDIAQDEFVIEYVGELITHDEGVRREARRGDVFDETSNSSYLFTLLEHEGIWVDAAIYGNLSRYINHASEYDRKACNITPKILYVNGEFRIKFSALREVKAGEELFFNYGDNFPNLTKKLLEQDDDRMSDNGIEGGAKAQKRKGGAGRKTTVKIKGKDIDFPPLPKGARGKPRKGRSPADDDPMDWMAGIPPLRDDDDDMADEYEEHTPRRRKKRGGRRPGAGRKKKQQPLSNAEGMANGASQPTAEISDSQGESANDVSNPSTPTRRRRLPKRLSATHSAQSGQSDFGRSAGNSGSEIGVILTAKPSSFGQQPDQPVKKASKRGGARPGAGRKPKHPRPAAPKTDANLSETKAESNIGDSNKNAPDDSDDLPLMGQQTGRVRGPERLSGGNGSGGATAAGRKRKAVELESEHEDGITIAGTTSGGGSMMFRTDQFQPMSDVAMDDDDDEDDDEDVVDRSERKRQKPLRYRTDNII
ncbi:hypothetical protein B0T22DRAFT_47747 [Podospora appendiculata]|uniref:Histone-lysine N-methyltransferase EZH2 n=1 Tax=Podospora appendiculata TaxID=314037 RepID=A0AAE1CGI3_9PEZI|nr:hypothetical protein B0T22DRAFT_47747 [Podospora appendiculata]